MTGKAGLESPCIKVCKLDKTGEICLGCFRTRAEIAAWSSADQTSKARILLAAKARSEKTS